MPGEKGRIEGEHSSRCLLMLAVAKRKETAAAPPRLATTRKRGECVDAKVRTDPGQAERQSQQ